MMAERPTPSCLLCYQIEHVDHALGIGELAIEVGPGRIGVGDGVFK